MIRKIATTGELTALGVTGGVILLAAIIFAHDIALAILLAMTLFFVFVIPGFALVSYLLPEWHPPERAALSLFAGIGVFSTTAFILGFFRIPAVNQVFGILIVFAAIITLYLRKRTS